MMPVVDDARIRRSRASLEAALLKLLQHRSLGEITIQTLTDQAGVGYATFFRHYTGKDVLLEALTAEQIRNLVALTLPLRSTVAPRRSCLALCEYVDRERDIWRVLLTGGAAGMMRESFIEAARKVAIETDAEPNWLPVELGVVHSASAILEILAWWLRQAEPITTHDLAEIIDQLVISPLGA